MYAGDAPAYNGILVKSIQSKIALSIKHNFLHSDFWGLDGGGGERQRGRSRWPGNTKAPGRHKAIRGLATTL